jgi:EAL domain-containing protein (putative c-di-GMP-specific phosphodiesterase class I)
VDVVPVGGGPLGPTDAVETARRLQDLVRSDDAIARAGDGFVLVLQWQVDDPAIRSLSDRVSAALAHPLSDGRAPDLRVGVLATPDPGLDPEAVLAGADALVSGAVAGGPVVLATGAGTTHPGITVASVDAALTSGQLRLCYQPVVDVQTGRAAGAEALVRWEHPELGRLAPAQFLPAVDAAGALVRLGEWVLEEAVGQVARWQSVADLDYYRVGINLAPMHVETVDVAGHVRTLLDRYEVPADRFIVELVESEALTERALVARRVRDLIDLGLRVAIDDFGSGFANMSYLRDLPVDVIKVDRALVGTRPTRRDEAILRAVAAVAAAVGADVLLEGIETPDQLDLARRVGVRFGQGMLLGPPVPPGATPPRPLAVD